jgi:hypothetical protein
MCEAISPRCFSFFVAIALEAQELAVPEAIGASERLEKAEPVGLTPRFLVPIREVLQPTLQIQRYMYVTKLVT